MGKGSTSRVRDLKTYSKNFDKIKWKDYIIGYGTKPKKVKWSKNQSNKMWENSQPAG